jgi:hypothetical protein
MDIIQYRYIQYIYSILTVDTGRCNGAEFGQSLGFTLSMVKQLGSSWNLVKTCLKCSWYHYVWAVLRSRVRTYKNVCLHLYSRCPPWPDTTRRLSRIWNILLLSLMNFATTINLAISSYSSWTTTTLTRTNYYF